MAKQVVEQNIKSQARRRLIGAIVLALAVVVILPMVLDSEPEISGQDIDLRIPPPDEVGELKPGASLSEVPETQAESAIGSATVSVEKQEKRIAAAVDKTRQAKPIVKVHAVPKKASHYVVQVGAFSNADAAKREAAKLKAWGFKVYTVLVEGTTRVRVGSYVDRTKLDKVKRLLEKHGLHPVVIEVK
ncbi:MAG: SPOR domain-containing protein [Gallionella sp.]